MDKLILIIKGFFIGIGKILPGVSGSLIAIMLGVYDKILDIISHFFKNMKENIHFIVPLGIGILMSIMFMSKILFYLINHYYVITMLFFIGLIFGGIPSIIKKVKLKFNFNIIYMIVSFLFIISLYFIKVENNQVNNYSIFVMFLIGILDATTMIIPGISGTAIMMLLGCYGTVLNMFSNIFLVDNLSKSIPFFMGVIVGVIIVSKIISYCFKKYREQTFYAIIGFTISSSLLLLVEVFNVSGGLFDYVIGLVLLIIGFKVSSLLE